MDLRLPHASVSSLILIDNALKRAFVNQRFVKTGQKLRLMPTILGSIGSIEQGYAASDGFNLRIQEPK